MIHTVFIITKVVHTGCYPTISPVYSQTSGQIRGPPSRCHLESSHKIGPGTRTRTAGLLENVVPGKGPMM